MPEGQHLDPPWRTVDYPVVQVVSDSRQVYASNARETRVASQNSKFGLCAENSDGSFQVLAKRGRSF